MCHCAWSTGYRSYNSRFFRVFWPEITLSVGGFPRVRTRATGSWGFPYFLNFFPFYYPSFFFHSTCLTSNTTSFSNPFTGYLPAIFIGSAFNDYISYKSLLFSDMLCSTPWIFCYIFRDLLTFYSLIVRFCWVFFVNYLSITTFLDSFL